MNPEDFMKEPEIKIQRIYLKGADKLFGVKK